ncbi:7737_t:CDS:2 [Gigaspora margarita]|uniref:7737_t:CDS:1 n=1 Tax=Gigaspora margarita TaxID=4874 RepID=A0ABN7UP12_GIGMA|nr:7737_t:CDS:2 [Gigaspora margarita]
MDMLKAKWASLFYYDSRLNWQENEFTRNVPELTRQSETNLVSRIKNLVPKNNIGKPNNSKGKDKVDLQETYIQKQEKEFKQPLLNKKNKNSRNNTEKENRKEDQNKETLQVDHREKEGKWLNTKHLNYASFWSKREEDKNKGADIGILVREHWQNDNWEDYKSCLENKLQKMNPYQETIDIKLKEEQIDIE